MPDEGSDASADQDVSDVRHRLDEIRSFILWTAPLYVVFAGTGLYETHLRVTLALVVLLAVLAAFGALDGLILASLQGLRSQLTAGPRDLGAARARLERLSRTVLAGGAGLALAGVSAVVMLAFS